MILTGTRLIYLITTDINMHLLHEISQQLRRKHLLQHTWTGNGKNIATMQWLHDKCCYEDHNKTTI